MKDIAGLFREFARLDLMRVGPGLSVAELERWSKVKALLESDLSGKRGVVADERRSSRRVPTHLICSYGSARDLRDAAVTQLSTGGVFVSTRTPLPIGSRLVLRIQIEDSGVEVEVDGTVVSNNVDADLLSGRAGMGVRFTTVNPEMIEAISELYAQEICRERLAGAPRRKSDAESRAAAASAPDG